MASHHAHGEPLVLYRPVGARELTLIAASGYRAFPPRLPSQPMFYPVLTESYAVEIARDWNTKDEASGYAGFVTRFAIDGRYAQLYPVQTVGGQSHQELWIPADDLAEFNRHIIGTIEVIAKFRGERAALDWEP